MPSSPSELTTGHHRSGCVSGTSHTPVLCWQSIGQIVWGEKAPKDQAQQRGSKALPRGRRRDKEGCGEEKKQKDTAKQHHGEAPSPRRKEGTVTPRGMVQEKGEPHGWEGVSHS